MDSIAVAALATGLPLSLLATPVFIVLMSVSKRNNVICALPLKSMSFPTPSS